MARNYFSPYAPRRRSNRMVLIWVTLFFSIIFFMWWIQTRHHDAARAYADLLVRGPRMEGDKARGGRILEDA